MCQEGGLRSGMCSKRLESAEGVRFGCALFFFFKQKTAYEIVADIEAYLRRRGCPDNFMIIGSGGIDVLGMTPPSERRIARGDLVTTELTPAVEGYFAQICRTLVVGRATAAQRRAFDVFREALAAGIAAVRPRATAA